MGSYNFCPTSLILLCLLSAARYIRGACVFLGSREEGDGVTESIAHSRNYDLEMEEYLPLGLRQSGMGITARAG